MPVNFNLDLAARRKERQALDALEKIRQQQQQAFGGLTTQLFGAPTEGPPTAAGIQSRIGGIMPGGPQANLAELQMASGVPEFQSAGFTSAQQQLEAERQRQLQLAQQGQTASAFAGIPTEGRPGLDALIKGAQLPGDIGNEFRKRLAETLTPTTLGAEQTLMSPFGQKIAGLEPGIVPPKEKRQAEKDLLGQFLAQTKDFDLETAAMSKIKSLGTTSSPTAATDNSLIFQLARLQSPGIVTKDDFEQLKKTGGLSDTVQYYLNQVGAEGKLPPHIRAQLVQSAALQYKGGLDLYNMKKTDWTRLAESKELNPRNVTGIGRPVVDVDKYLVLPPPGANPRKVQ